jgi:four helix bundle protein
MGVQVFTDLKIWQRARKWSKDIFKLTKRDPFPSDRRLVDQINDSSDSVMANIAEGFGRGTQGEFIQFLSYSLGSLNETQSHLTVAHDREYVTRDEYAALFGEGTEIRKMTVAFITSMVMTGSGVKNIKKPQNFAYDVWEIYERVTGKERSAHAPRPQEQRS